MNEACLNAKWVKKNLTTAEGGALTWNTIDGISNEDIYKNLRMSDEYA